MCGVPVDRADDYLQRLIGLGHRVAVCEQTEDPAEAKKRGAKSVVRRDVVRLVTPGHDHRGAPARARPGQFPARHRPPPRLRHAMVLRARGRRHLHRPFRPERDGRHRPSGRDRPLRAARDPGAGRDPRRSGPGSLLAARRSASITPLPREGLDPASAERRLKELFRGRDPRRLRRLQPGRDHGGRQRALLHREDADRQPSGRSTRPPATPPARRLPSMRRPAPTWNSPAPCPGERAGSLLATIDCTVTPGGARLLAERLAGPLTHPDRIRDRQDSVAASSRTATCATGCGASSSARPIWRAPSRASASDAAARAISPACATACSPRASSGSNSPSRPICRGSCARPRRCLQAPAHGCRRQARGGACRRTAAPEARWRLHPRRLRPQPRRAARAAAGFAPLHRGAAEPLRDGDRLPHLARQAQPHDRLFRGGAAECGRGSAEGALEGHLRPSPDHGGRHALLDRGTRRARIEDRLRRPTGR